MVWLETPANYACTWSGISVDGKLHQSKVRESFGTLFGKEAQAEATLDDLFLEVADRFISTLKRTRSGDFGWADVTARIYVIDQIGNGNHDKRAPMNPRYGEFLKDRESQRGNARQVLLIHRNDFQQPLEMLLAEVGFESKPIDHYFNFGVFASTTLKLLNYLIVEGKPSGYDNQKTCNLYRHIDINWSNFVPSILPER